MEILILIGGAYALYTVGMAIATELDYRAVNRRKQWKLTKLEQVELFTTSMK